MSQLLNREALLTKEDLKVEKVDLNSGNFVFVRQMTGRERDTFEQSIVEVHKDNKGNQTFNQNLKDFRAKLAVNTVCDEKGNLLLKPKDFELLSTSMSASNLESIVNKAQDLNGMSTKDVDGLVKN